MDASKTKGFDQSVIELQQEITQTVSMAEKLSTRDLKKRAVYLNNLNARVHLLATTTLKESPAGELQKDLSEFVGRFKKLSDALELKIAAKVEKSALPWIRRLIEYSKKPPVEFREQILSIKAELIQYNKDKALSQLRKLSPFIPAKEGKEAPFSEEGLTAIQKELADDKYVITPDPEKPTQFILSGRASKEHESSIYSCALTITLDGRLRLSALEGNAWQPATKTFDSPAKLQEFLRDAGLTSPSTFAWRESFLGKELQANVDALLLEKQKSAAAGEVFYAIHEALDQPGQFKITYYDQETQGCKNMPVGKEFKIKIKGQEYTCSPHSPTVGVPFKPIFHNTASKSTIEKLPHYHEAHVLTKFGTIAVDSALRAKFGIDAKGRPLKEPPVIGLNPLIYPDKEGRLRLATLEFRKAPPKPGEGPYEVVSYMIRERDGKLQIFEADDPYFKFDAVDTSTVDEIELLEVYRPVMFENIDDFIASQMEKSLVKNKALIEAMGGGSYEKGLFLEKGLKEDGAVRTGPLPEKSYVITVDKGAYRLEAFIPCKNKHTKEVERYEIVSYRLQQTTTGKILLTGTLHGELIMGSTLSDCLKKLFTKTS